MSNDTITVPFINIDEAFELQSHTLPALPPAAKRLVLLHWGHRCPFHGTQRVEAEVLVRIDQDAGDDLSNLVPVCPECAAKHEAVPFTAETRGKLREFARVFVDGLAGLRLVPKHKHPAEPEVEPRDPEPTACQHHGHQHGEVPEGYKRCTKCGEVLPIEQFSKNRTRKDGLHGWCRRCDAEHHADYHAANLALNRKLEATGSNPRIPVSKTCSTCGVEKAASEFSRSRNRADGLESRCRQCESERKATRYARTKAPPVAPQPSLSLPTPSAPDLDPQDRIGRTNGFRALAGRSPIKLD